MLFRLLVDCWRFRVAPTYTELSLACCIVLQLRLGCICSYLKYWNNMSNGAEREPGASHEEASGSGRPLHLIYQDPVSKKLELGKEAVSLLRSLKKPLAVIAMCGRARTGKSYILNQLLGQSGGFPVDSSHRPCTKGIWIWSAPLSRRALDGSEYHLLLLDTEGIDATNQVIQLSCMLLCWCLHVVHANPQGMHLQNVSNMLNS